LRLLWKINDMRRLSELLLERGLITARDCTEAEAIQRESGAALGAILVRLGAISEETLLGVLSEQIGLPMLDLPPPSVEQVREAASEVGATLAWLIDNEVIVWRGEGGLFCVAGPHVHNSAIQEAIEQWRTANVKVYFARSIVLEPVLLSLRGYDSASSRNDPSRLLELAEEAPVIDFVNSVLAEAVSLRASDVHFEPFENRLLVRLRVDGVLTQRRVVSRELFDAVASRIKLLSGMDIAERRLPQDGRQSMRVAGRDLDVRVSTLPTTWGESIVVRLLGNTRRIPELDALGLTNPQRETLADAIAQPNGLVLVTGPTGSGKTTTVYRLLSQLNDGVRKIVTIEDPVEFDLPGVLQMAVHADIDLDFAKGLRSILRQDPDVIFVGEIRDSETARTAVQAALTGHLVISTVHTNSALAAAARMVDLGVEKFLLADVLRTLIGQRLVRCVCPKCAAPDTNPAHEARAQALLPPQLRQGPPAFREGRGCAACGKSGFQGRVGVYEAVKIDARLQQAIRNGAAESDLVQLARAQGFTSLPENGLAKARDGQTSYREALRVLGMDAT
jgi:general secretion pathway protein E